jgi:hypothetical protein
MVTPPHFVTIDFLPRAPISVAEVTRALKHLKPFKSISLDQGVLNCGTRTTSGMPATVQLCTGSKKQTSYPSFPFPFVPLQRRGCLVAPWFL